MAIDSTELWITRSTAGGGGKKLLFPSSLLLCLLNLVQKELTSKAGAEIHNLRGAEYFTLRPEMSETTLNQKDYWALRRAGEGSDVPLSRVSIPRGGAAALGKNWRDRNHTRWCLWKISWNRCVSILFIGEGLKWGRAELQTWAELQTLQAADWCVCFPIFYVSFMLFCCQFVSSIADAAVI